MSGQLAAFNICHRVVGILDNDFPIQSLFSVFIRTRICCKTLFKTSRGSFYASLQAEMEGALSGDFQILKVPQGWGQASCLGFRFGFGIFRGSGLYFRGLDPGGAGFRV